MSTDRSWMQRRVGKEGITYEFEQGVNEFLNFAYSNEECVMNDMIKCPCSKCQLTHFQLRYNVKLHLFRDGFKRYYTIWDQHGERVPPQVAPVEVLQPVGTSNPFKDLVMDAGGFQYDFDRDDEDMEELPNSTAKNFYDLLEDADEPLWDGCTSHSKLSMMTRFMNIKSKYGIPDEGAEEILQMCKSGMPKDEKLPKTYYKLKQKMKKLGLSYKKIHSCVNDCVLYYGEHSNDTQCPTCNHPRYKPESGLGGKKRIANKVLRYLPLTPRLQRLYQSNKTAEHMRWHSQKRKEKANSSNEGELEKEEVGMVHPVDCEAWKHFDRTYPSFASEVRNVRLGLATDGFSPFALRSTNYSCWPVFVFPYNLPPWMCMTKPFMFLTMIISGPKSPGKDIDVYLRPLIDELKMLWKDGVETFDASRKQNFQMKAALMWTISDFPAYGMLSGWSTHGNLACPYCMERNKAYRLKHSMKPSWFDCHRKFLPCRHRFRTDNKKFKKGVRVTDVGIERITGDEVKTKLFRLQKVPFGKGYRVQKVIGFGQDHNWTKQSIFFELPYWSKVFIRHNLDVMHIEKNVFDNIFNTVMNVKGKSKDHLQGRLDMREMNIRQELHPKLINDKVTLPQAKYCLSKDEVRQVCEWISKLKFPDGYASNISRCVNVADCKISGFKSHDCHVFMQRLLPIVFSEILPREIAQALAELSKFFRDLCSTSFKESDMDVLQSNIIETVCKLEKIFPPSFFDSMEHLIIHLAYEAKVGGPVQYRWMYPIERELYDLKKKVRNKAHVEGSIVEAYCTEELVTFCSHYFGPDVPTKLNRPDRNFDGGKMDPKGRLSIFTYPGRSIGKTSQRYLEDVEYTAAFLYTILNCDEIVPFFTEFETELRNNNPIITEEHIEQEREKKFVGWFQNRVRNDNEIDDRLRKLADGPNMRIYCWKGYIVNGFKFHTKDVESTRKTQNNGVMIKGSTWNESYCDFYGVLKDVIELDFDGGQVVLFKCDWVDTTRKGIKVDEFGNVRVNPKILLKKYEPFVFASQATQVFYVPCVTKKQKYKDLFNVIKVKARNTYFMPDYEEEDEIPIVDEILQEDDNTPIRRHIDDIFVDIGSLRVDGPGQEVTLPPNISLNTVLSEIGDEVGHELEYDEDEIEGSIEDVEDDEDKEESEFDSDSVNSDDEMSVDDD